MHALFGSSLSSWDKLVALAYACPADSVRKKLRMDSQTLHSESLSDNVHCATRTVNLHVEPVFSTGENMNNSTQPMDRGITSGFSVAETMNNSSRSVNLGLIAGFSDAGTVNSNTRTVDLSVPPGFTLAALCGASGLTVERETSTLQATADQNLTVVQNAQPVTVTDLMNSLPATAGFTTTANGPVLQLSGLGSQNAIITFHTLPFMEGGQEIAITETCLPANFSLNSGDPTSLVQSFFAQDVGVKPADSEKSTAVNESPFLDFTSTSIAREGLSLVTSQLNDSGTSDLAPAVTTVHSQDVIAPLFTDDTPIFTRVCATLNADIINCVPGSRDLLLDHLNQEENTQLKIDNQQCFTLEAPLSTITRVHDSLKDIMNLPSRIGLASKSLVTPPKKTEERGVSCRLLLPFVSSKGRHIKMPGHLPAVWNDNDPFKSEDSDYEVKPSRHRRKGRPKKLEMNNSVVRRSAVQSGEASEHSTDLNGSITFEDADDARNSRRSANEAEEQCEKPQNDYDFQYNNMENVVDSSQQLGVLRKARKQTHVSQATRMRRIYEGRIKFKFFCDKCSFKSKRESHYRKHIKLHEGAGIELHRCTECDFTTIRLSHLRRHELLHKKTLLKCNLCGYMTDSNQMLMKHIKMKHPHGRNSSISQQQLFRCEVCGHSSSNRKYFTRHLLRHARDSNNVTVNGPDGFQCTECSKTFQRRVHYERHQRDVHGPQLRPHLCDICGKSFKRSDALQQHKVVHTSQANRNYHFSCTKCNKGFRSQAHLKEHLTMHSSERPFLCQYCGSSFKTQSVQRKHTLSLHVKPRAHPCQLCSKKFNTPYALRRHSHIHEAEAQKIAAQNSASMTIHMDMDSEDPTHLEQVNSDAAVVAVAEAGDGLQVQQQTLAQDVMASGIEESLEQGDALQTQYIVQGNETATALFYLTNNL